MDSANFIYATDSITYLIYSIRFTMRIEWQLFIIQAFQLLYLYIHICLLKIFRWKLHVLITQLFQLYCSVDKG